MSNSNAREAPDAKHERVREERVTSIKHWVVVRTHSPNEWGEQRNHPPDSLLESTRRCDIDAEHRRRVEQVGHDDSR